MPRKRLNEFTLAEAADRISRERKQERLREFYQLGAETVAGYCVGDLFIGAWGEADRLGLTQIDERVAFIEGFLAHQPRQVRFGADGKIVDIVNKE